RTMALDSLARILMERGNYSEARRYHSDYLSLAHESGDKVDISNGLDGLARVTIAQGDPERGLMLAAAADSVRTREGYQAPRAQVRRFQASIDSARMELGRGV